MHNLTYVLQLFHDTAPSIYLQAKTIIQKVMWQLSLAICNVKFSYSRSNAAIICYYFLISFICCCHTKLYLVQHDPTILATLAPHSKFAWFHTVTGLTVYIVLIWWYWNIINSHQIYGKPFYYVFSYRCLIYYIRNLIY